LRLVYRQVVPGAGETYRGATLAYLPAVASVRPNDRPHIHTAGLQTPGLTRGPRVIAYHEISPYRT
jgi:hypothetical protein